jgi:SAM-dependent methyltransferase
MSESQDPHAEHDAWSAGRSYDEYMGRWSRAIATLFVDRLGVSPGLDWIDVGCGTGALTATVLERCAPRSVLGVDPSDGFVGHARDTFSDARARFEVGTGDALPGHDRSADVVASALAYNFMPDRQAALDEFRRVARPDATIAFYVWDYPGGGVGFIDAFWKAAIELDPAAATHDESTRFPFCVVDELHREVSAAGYQHVSVEAIEVSTPFDDFAAFWHPFTLGAGPAPGYLASLPADSQRALRLRLNDQLGNTQIDLVARAWAVMARPGWC